MISKMQLTPRTKYILNSFKPPLIVGAIVALGIWERIWMLNHYLEFFLAAVTVVGVSLVIYLYAKEQGQDYDRQQSRLNNREF